MPTARPRGSFISNNQFLALPPLLFCHLLFFFYSPVPFSVSFSFRSPLFPPPAPVFQPVSTVWFLAAPSRSVSVFFSVVLNDLWSFFSFGVCSSSLSPRAICLPSSFHFVKITYPQARSRPVYRRPQKRAHTDNVSPSAAPTPPSFSSREARFAPFPSRPTKIVFLMLFSSHYICFFFPLSS